jgi:hypothetical protein
MEDVLGQLDWLTAELEAQKPFLTRIPEVQFTARPLAEEPSLLGLYEAMAERERGYLAQLGISGEEEIPESIGDVLSALIALRNKLLATLGALSETAWEQRVPTATEGT